MTATLISGCVQLDHVAVRVGDVHLLPRRHVVGPELAGDSRRLQLADRALVVSHGEREVSVAQVDLGRAAQRTRTLMDDEMHLTAVGQLIPRALERERRPGDLSQAKHAAVEPFRARDIGHADGDVMERSDVEHAHEGHDGIEGHEDSIVFFVSFDPAVAFVSGRWKL